jgi:ATP-dependent exoDNAse (exonuclease V) alpha subunit
MAATGRLGEDTLDVAGRELAAGDEIVCLRNDRRLGVLNGTNATITALDRADRAIAVTTKGGTEVMLPAGYLDAGHVAHSYATTIHKAQGATYDRAFLLGSDALYREAGYAALSRARHGTDLYLVDTHPAPGPQRHIPLEPTVDLARQLLQSKAQHLALDDHLDHEHRDRRRGREPDVGLGR